MSEFARRHFEMHMVLCTKCIGVIPNDRSFISAENRGQNHLLRKLIYANEYAPRRPDNMKIYLRGYSLLAF